MENVLNLKLPGTVELGEKELKRVNGGMILGALGFGLAGMVFAYQFGRDVAVWVKAQESKMLKERA